MSTASEELRRSVALEGWCVIEGVIPEEEVHGILQTVLKLVETQRAERERWPTETNARGHWHGAHGVENA